MTKAQNSNKIREYLGSLKELISQDKIPSGAYKIHERAGHTDHKRCVVLGLNATMQAMCTDGAEGSYFTMDESGQLYEQHFTQGPEEHDYQDCNKITVDYFLNKIEQLQKENMANKEEIISKLERYLKDAK